MRFPAPIQNLIEEFANLPGVGRKTAERYVFYLLKQPKGLIDSFSKRLNELQANTYLCSDCANFSPNQGICHVCRSSSRDKSIICVVEESHDLNVIEATNEYLGLYHVLGGTINPIDGITEDNLNVNKLIERVENNNVSEIILALNPDMPGEATSIFLKNRLQSYNLKVTRLARGLPMGSDLEYADEITLSSALKGRKEI